MSITRNETVDMTIDPSMARRRALLASATIVVSGFYRSIEFWTVNAWDLASPAKTLQIGAGVAVVALLTLALLVKLGFEPLATGLAIGGVLMVLAHWKELTGSIGPALVGMILILAWFIYRAGTPRFVEWLAIALITAFGLVPIAQLMMAHVRDSTPYPLVNLPAARAAEPSGLVEDVVVVIVDTYPNLRIAEEWFGHRPDELIEFLESQGFVVPSSAWSRHTFTSMSVSSILELKSVIEPGPTEKWGNRSSLWRILRGDNLVSQTLESAGFRYTHVESGWEGTACGPQVDRCIQSPWIDEQVWGLISPTIVGDWVESRHHFYRGTLNTAAVLEEQLSDLLTNGSRDYLFAHLLLPHRPILADQECHLRNDFEEGEPDISQVSAAYGEQMTCVDLLLLSAISADDDTAMLITGDHGTTTGGQVAREPDDWSDADIAERFGVFTAYRLPSECDPPSLPDPMVAMSAILSCAVEADFSVLPPVYVIGDDEPSAVAPDRMAQIQAQVEAGSLQPDPE